MRMAFTTHAAISGGFERRFLQQGLRSALRKQGMNRYLMSEREETDTVTADTGNLFLPFLTLSKELEKHGIEESAERQTGGSFF